MTNLLTEPEEPDGIEREYLTGHTAPIVGIRMVFALPDGRRYVSEYPASTDFLKDPDADPERLNLLVAAVRDQLFTTVGDSPCTIQLLIPERYR